MVRFIHAADIHLDSPLRGLSAHEGAPVATLRTATRLAFSRLVDAALSQSVDFLVLAGDLYDGDWRDYNTGLFFCREMGRLNRAGIPVLVVYGNHDAESEISKRLPLPENVRVFSARAAETVRLEGLRVAVHGRSFKEAVTTENLVPGYPAPLPGWVNIGVLHTALEGNAAHATYAPCSLAELHARGYDYWALGHVHEYAVLSENPWVVYPGNLQGRHVRECGPRGAVLVSGEAGRIGIERLIFDVVRWNHLRVDVSDRASFDAVVDAVGAALARLRDAEGDERPLPVRISLFGQTAAHGALFGLERQLRAEIAARAAGLAGEQLWVERVVIETSPPAAALAGRGDALADLQAFLDAAPEDADLRQEITAALQDFIAKAPHELLQALPELEPIRQGEIEPLIRRVAPALLARIATVD